MIWKSCGSTSWRQDWQRGRHHNHGTGSIYESGCCCKLRKKTAENQTRCDGCMTRGCFIEMDAWIWTYPLLTRQWEQLSVSKWTLMNSSTPYRRPETTPISNQHWPCPLERRTCPLVNWLFTNSVRLHYCPDDHCSIAVETVGIKVFIIER